MTRTKRVVNGFSIEVDFREKGFCSPYTQDETKAQTCLSVSDTVWATRSPENWRPSDNSLIAEYSVVTADLHFLQDTLTNTGYFSKITGKGGAPRIVASPLVDVVHRLSSRRAKLAGVLSLTSTAGLGDPRTVAAAGKDFREANPRGPQIEGVISMSELLK